MSAIRSASVAIHGVDDHAAVARGIDTRIVELSADRDVIAVEVTPITETVDTIPGMVSGRTVTDRVIVTVVWREADAASANGPLPKARKSAEYDGWEFMPAYTEYAVSASEYKLGVVGEKLTYRHAHSCIPCLGMAVYRTKLPIAASRRRCRRSHRLRALSRMEPSLPSISGELRAGSTVALTLGMPGRPSPKVKSKLGDVTPGRRLTWHGNAGADWLFAGDREFLIDAQPDETVLFTHVEDVHGALFPLFRAFMGSAIQRSHDAFNAALKDRAEGRVSTMSP